MRMRRRWGAAVAVAALAACGGKADDEHDRRAGSAAVVSDDQLHALELRRATMELSEVHARLAALQRFDPCSPPGGPPSPPAPPPPLSVPTTLDGLNREVAATKVRLAAIEAQRQGCLAAEAAAKAMVAMNEATQVATAIDLATLPPIGPRVPSAKIQIHAADIDLDELLLAVHGGPMLRVGDDTDVTGVITAATPRAAALSIAGSVPGKVITSLAGGGGRKVNLWFADAPTVALWRIVAQVGQRNVFVVDPTPVTTVLVENVGVDSVARAIAALHGLVIDEPRRAVWVVRPQGSAELDGGLLKLGDTKITIDSLGATFGELLAALQALGLATPGAPCTGGPTLDWRAVEAPLGPTVAALALQAGLTPGDASCELPPVAAPTVGNGPVALLRVGDRRAAIVVTPTGHGLVVDAPAGATWQLTDEGLVLTDGTGRVRPEPNLDATWPGAGDAQQVLTSGRLAATVVGTKEPTAVFQLPDGSWNLMTPRDAGRLAPWLDLKIEPGRVSYSAQPPGAPPATRTILLHAK